jgi:hypothetical protein
MPHEGRGGDRTAVGVYLEISEVVSRLFGFPEKSDNTYGAELKHSRLRAISREPTSDGRRKMPKEMAASGQRGRPALPDHMRLTASVRGLISQQQRDALFQRAEERGHSVSHLLRLAIDRLLEATEA